MTDNAIFLETIHLRSPSMPYLDMTSIPTTLAADFAHGFFEWTKDSFPAFVVRRARRPDAQLRTAHKLVVLFKKHPTIAALHEALAMPVVRLPADRLMWGTVVLKSLKQAHRDDMCFVVDSGRLDSFLQPQFDQLLEQLAAKLAAAEATLDLTAEKLLAPFVSEKSALKVGTDIDEEVKADAAAFQETIALRDRLLLNEKWYSSEQVAQLARGALVDSNKNQFAQSLRAAGRLLGVRFKGKRLHPAFQFVERVGEPHPAMKELLAVLPTDDIGWDTAFWFFQPTGRLGGERPADVLQRDPGAVVAAARKDFEGDSGI